MKWLPLAGAAVVTGGLAATLAVASSAAPAHSAGSAAPVAATLTDATAANCTIVVPSDPLSAAGLATPYQLVPTGQTGVCDDANSGDAAFVQGVIINPTTGQISVYNPLVLAATSAG